MTKGIPSYDINENVAWDNIPYFNELDALATKADAVCFGSLACRSVQSRQTIFNFLRATPKNCLKVFDINLRQHYYNKELLEKAFEIADILKLNDEEIETVALCFKLSGKTDAIISSLLKKYQFKAVILTKGAKGASYFSAEGVFECKPMSPDKAVSTVGCGDSFTAMLISRLLYGDAPQNAVDAAEQIASFVSTQTESMPTLPEDLLIYKRKKSKRNKKMLPILVYEKFRIIAHRGASGYAPENTMPAFKLAAKMGINDFELDVQLTKDGKVVICHDNTLARYGHGDKIIEQTKWNELAELDMGTWFSPYLFADVRMITLKNLFEQFNNEVTYHIELKCHTPKIADKTLEIIDTFGLRDNCIITSFFYDELLKMKNICPEIKLGWLVEKLDVETLKLAENAGFYQICPRATGLDAGQVEKAYKFISRVRAWGINGTQDKVIELVYKCIDAGCDGATINWPDWLYKN
jgi:glycerophosphoryl diester phosphodiesterase